MGVLEMSPKRQLWGLWFAIAVAFLSLPIFLGVMGSAVCYCLLMAKQCRLELNLIFNITEVSQVTHGEGFMMHQEKPQVFWAPQHRGITIHGYLHRPSRHDGLGLQGKIGNRVNGNEGKQKSMEKRFTWTPHLAPMM